MTDRIRTIIKAFVGDNVLNDTGICVINNPAWAEVIL